VESVSAAEVCSSSAGMSPVHTAKAAGAVRSDGTPGDRPGSMGLGLYIVREVAIAHGGSAAVSSSVAEGTTFTLRLPRSRR
jgi:signal transduction histidine kinase